MDDRNLQDKIINASKWSSLTEVAAKLVSPITNMILARLLVPEAFGVVATITMITSFADMFTDAGFQKYLVQHSFKNEEEKHKNANVAFWTNFALSVLIWFFIIIFRNQIAFLVGNPGLGYVIAIASFQLLLTSFSSIQMALYRRDFDFKTLFIVRMVSVLVPFVATIPLALMGLGYWALIIGSLIMQLLNAVILTIKSNWKPKLCYDVAIIKEMFSFSVWSLIEAVSMWLTIWIDAFIIGVVLDQYYLGLYRTSKTMVDALMTIVTASIIPVLFSTLSRLQNNEDDFKKAYLKIQRLVSYLLFPMGVGLYLYSDLATSILLGSQWSEASEIIGIWALTSSITIVLGQLCGEVYRSKGRPKLSFVTQLMHLVVLVPTIIISSRYGFWQLVYARSLVRLQYVLIHFIVMKIAMGFPIMTTMKNILPAGISAVSMGITGYLLRIISDNILWSFLSIAICTLFYFCMMLLFPTVRNELLNLVKKIFPKTIYIKRD